MNITKTKYTLYALDSNTAVSEITQSMPKVKCIKLEKKWRKGTIKNMIKCLDLGNKFKTLYKKEGHEPFNRDLEVKYYTQKLNENVIVIGQNTTNQLDMLHDIYPKPEAKEY